MSCKPVLKSSKNSRSDELAPATLGQDLCAHLPSVRPAPGEHADHASAIPLAVHAKFAPRNGFETLLVEEISDLTRRIRLDERRLEQIHRVKRNDLLMSVLKRSAMGKRTTVDASDKMACELVQALASGSAEEVQEASKILVKYSVDIEKIETQAWIASARYIDQLNRQIAGSRRQRQQAILDLDQLRRIADLDTIADAEEVE